MTINDLLLSLYGTRESLAYWFGEMWYRVQNADFLSLKISQAIWLLIIAGYIIFLLSQLVDKETSRKKKVFYFGIFLILIFGLDFLSRHFSVLATT